MKSLLLILLYKFVNNYLLKSYELHNDDFFGGEGHHRQIDHRSERNSEIYYIGHDWF